MKKKWTDEENAIIREIWASSRPVKEGFHRLPNRGERAILYHAQALGISGNRCIEKHARSMVLTLVHRAMKEGASMSSPEIAKRYSCSVKHAGELLAASRERKEIHISEWIRNRVAGPYVAVYAWGNKPDAVRPASKTSKEYNRRRYLNKKLDSGKFNPFATAISQVTNGEKITMKPSKGSYGSRVHYMEAA